MRCPKCQYISFDSGDRCRNCGYEFSLTVDVEALDLPIQTGDEAIGPMGDLALSELDAPAASVPKRRADVSAAARRGAPSTELPLFSPDDDAPLVAPTAVPRMPLSVRRSSPPMVRGQSRTALDEPQLDLEAPPQTRRDRAPAPSSHAPSEPAPDDDALAPAGVGPRLGAGLIDVALLAAIDYGVLYFTLKLCGLEWRQVLLLPPVPLVGFLLLLNGGYFVTFVAAGGQTIGKMASGIRVIPADEHAMAGDRVPLGHAVLRAAATLISLLPAGLGFLPALFARDHRALHDRLADTRVVKA